MIRKTICWRDNDDYAISDAHAEQFALNFLTSDLERIYVSNHLVCDYVRAYIVEHNHIHFEVVVQFQGKVYPITEYGLIENWPNELCKHGWKVAQRIISAAVNKRKFKRLDEKRRKDLL